MIIDFRVKKPEHQPIIIHDARVEVVTHYKYLGVSVSNDLTWTANTTALISKAKQRMYFLRQLKKFNVNRDILTLFYESTVQSVMGFALLVWWKGLKEKDKKHFNRIHKTAEQLIVYP